MAIFTSEELTAQIAAWKAALLGVSTSQSYRMPDGRQLYRADLPEIRRTLEWLDSQLTALTAGATGSSQLCITVGSPLR